LRSFVQSTVRRAQQVGPRRDATDLTIGYLIGVLREQISRSVDQGPKVADTTITQFERVKIGMETVVPIIRDFENEFGKEAVRRVLEARIERGIEQARSNEAYKDIQPNFEKARIGIEFYAAGNALQYDVIACDKDTLQFNVTGCQYARMMQELNATDLGHLLVCQGDFASAYRSGMELTRTQTRMQGFSHCDFHYHRVTS